MDMKKYKNSSLSLLSYIVAFLMVYWLFGSTSLPRSADFPMFWISLILVIIGIFLGYRSNKMKESKWAGYVLMGLGILSLLFLLIFIVFSYSLSS